MKLLSFDIEIADEFELKPGEDLLRYAPFHIAVAAAVAPGGESRLFYSEDANGKPCVEMTREKARELLQFLAGRQEEGWQLFAWNGLSFDLRWIGHNAEDMETAGRVALGLYDPMFQFFNQRGFPVSLSAVGEAMGIQQAKLMKSADAPKEWRRGNFDQVKKYVIGDCEITNQIVEQITRRRLIAWKTRKGTVSSEPMPRLKTVAEVLREPQPDQGWMTGGGMKRSDFAGWIPRHLLAEPER